MSQDIKDFVLIPTTFKSKIPHTLSYPIGAEAISKAFQEIPQLKEMELDFCFWRYLRPEQTHIHKVLIVTYARSAPTITTSKGDLGEQQTKPRWTVIVRPVLRDHRNVVRTKLEGKALPFAQKWLTENSTREEFGSMSLTFSFDDETELVTSVVESTLSPKRAK